MNPALAGAPSLLVGDDGQLDALVLGGERLEQADRARRGGLKVRWRARVARLLGGAAAHSPASRREKLVRKRQLLAARSAHVHALLRRAPGVGNDENDDCFVLLLLLSSTTTTRTQRDDGVLCGFFF